MRHYIAAYLAHEARYPTLLLTGAMVHGICALESSSYYMRFTSPALVATD